MSSSIDFIANGATSEGFNVSAGLSRRQKAIFDGLRQLLAPGNRQKIHLDLFTADISSADMAALSAVLQRLPGGKGPLLPTIGIDEYSCFETDFQCILHPLKNMRKDPPMPMVVSMLAVSR